MASAFSHAITAVAIGKISFRQPTGKKLWLLAMGCAVLPDADALGYMMGIPYDSLWGHRGITHSLCFALMLALLVATMGFRHQKTGSPRWWALVSFFFTCTASHAVLDAMTNGGRGVAFFAPFYNARYFFPFRPIQVSPIGITRFFSEWGWRVIQSEMIWIGVPSLVIIVGVTVGRRLFAK